MTTTATYYQAQIKNREGHWETKLNTRSKSKARKEFQKWQGLGWEVRIVTEATKKVLLEG